MELSLPGAMAIRRPSLLSSHSLLSSGCPLNVAVAVESRALRRHPSPRSQPRSAPQFLALVGVSSTGLSTKRCLGMHLGVSRVEASRGGVCPIPVGRRGAVHYHQWRRYSDLSWQLTRDPSSISQADDDTTNIPRTHLAFHYDAKQYTQETTVQSVRAFTALSPEDQALFKLPSPATAEDYVVITASTIFHPQGGGQPSDVGAISLVPSSPSSSEDPPAFTVTAARTSCSGGHVLHLGRFSSSSSPSSFPKDAPVRQSIDADKRLLYSRLHTAGHVLGSAVRHLVEGEVAGFDELKASHFPESAGCEFSGLIGGEWKEPIQRRLDEYVAAAMPVEIAWWDEADFRAHGLARLVPDDPKLKLEGGGKFRVVRIGGDTDVYPCGGTHVDTTDQAGPVKIRKIARSKGQSRVAYAVA